jgi:predicted acylesterase/phospholipase RssA/CRP-like cAMP-binding protein
MKIDYTRRVQHPVDRDVLRGALEGLGVEATAFLAAFDRLEWVDIEAGAAIARQGERCDALFVVLEGTLDVVRDGVMIARLKAPNVVGEGQILSGGVRTATVQAATPCQVVRLSSDSFAALCLEDHAFLSVIASLASRRQRANRLADYIRSTLDLDDDDLVARLGVDTTWRALARGDVLLRQGDAGDGLYLLVEGRLRVGDDRRYLADLLPGALVGELEMFTGGARTATVTASRASVVARLGNDALRQAIEASPALAMRLATVAVQRMMRSSALHHSEWASVNVTITSADSSIPVDDFAVRLEQALSSMGRVTRITRDRVGRALGQPELCDLPVDDPRATRLRAWRSEVEADHDFVLYAAERARAPWTAQCLDGSDIVLTLARPGTTPTPGLGDMLARHWVVIVHDDDRGQGAHTALWSKGDTVARYFHIRSGVPADFARLGRAVAGREVGLVLSGGGARSFAHLGTIRALEESGIPIDVLGGTSAGACVAAFYSLGLRGAALETTLRDVLGGRVDFTLPLYALARGRAMRRRMTAVFGDLCLEDLPLPMFCVATNISQFGLLLIDGGPAADALLASACLPGIFPPVSVGGQLMVDGGLVNAMPVDRMRELVGSTGVVVGSDVTGGGTPAPPPAGWLWRSLGGPLVAEVVSRAVAAAGDYQLRTVLSEGRPDLCVHHDTAEHSPVDFADPAPLREKGYRATLAALEAASPAIERRLGRRS